MRHGGRRRLGLGGFLLWARVLSYVLIGLTSSHLGVGFKVTKREPFRFRRWPSTETLHVIAARRCRPIASQATDSSRRLAFGSGSSKGPIELEGPQLTTSSAARHAGHFVRSPSLGADSKSTWLWHSGQAACSMFLLAIQPSYARTGETLSPSCANGLFNMCKVRTNSPHIIPSLYNPWRTLPGNGYGWRSWSWPSFDSGPPPSTFGRLCSIPSRPGLKTTIRTWPAFVSRLRVGSQRDMSRADFGSAASGVDYFCSRQKR